MLGLNHHFPRGSDGCLFSINIHNPTVKAGVTLMMSVVLVLWESTSAMVHIGACLGYLVGRTYKNQTRLHFHAIGFNGIHRASWTNQSLKARILGIDMWSAR